MKTLIKHISLGWHVMISTSALMVWLRPRKIHYGLLEQIPPQVTEPKKNAIYDRKIVLDKEKENCNIDTFQLFFQNRKSGHGNK